MQFGTVITFTSYSGGIGRTTAVANLAWLLASCGKRVLAVDWNLGEPRLANLFHPFWPVMDPRYASGVIDSLWEHVLEAYRFVRALPEQHDTPTLTQKAVRLACDFPNSGVLEFANAGFVESYRVRRRLFPWEAFYGELGGQAFVERLRRNFKAEYDYVIIDAPPFLADFSCACTLGVADVVAVGCVANRNDPLAAAEAMHGLTEAQRWLPIDRSPIRVIPVLMRTEAAEADALMRARERVRDAFARISALDPEATTWPLEIPQVAYYSYSSTLAVCRDDPMSPETLAGAYFNLLRSAGFLEPSELRPLSKSEQDAILVRSQSLPDPIPFELLSESGERRELKPCERSEGHFFISYSRDGFNRIALTLDQIQKMGFDIWWDEGIRGGVDWKEHLERRIVHSRAVLLFMDRRGSSSIWIQQEIASARAANKPIIPIRLDEPEPGSLFASLVDELQFLKDPAAAPSPELEATLRGLCS